MAANLKGFHRGCEKKRVKNCGCISFETSHGWIPVYGGTGKDVLWILSSVIEDGRWWDGDNEGRVSGSHR
jgi:hypothetical protein